jgi:hypothetical protein
MSVEKSGARKTQRSQVSFELAEVLHVLEALEGKALKPANGNTPQTA